MAKESLLTHLSAYADESSIIGRDKLYQRLRDVYFRGVKRISFKCTVEHTVIVEGHAKDIKGVVMGEFITNVSFLPVEQQIEAYIITKWTILKFHNDLQYEIKQI